MPGRGAPPGRARGGPPGRAPGRDGGAPPRPPVPGGGGMGLPVDEVGGRAGGGMALPVSDAGGAPAAAGAAEAAGAAGAEAGGAAGRTRSLAGRVGGAGGGSTGRVGPLLPLERTTRLGASAGGASGSGASTHLCGRGGRDLGGRSGLRGLDDLGGSLGLGRGGGRRLGLGLLGLGLGLLLGWGLLGADRRVLGLGLFDRLGLFGRRGLHEAVLLRPAPDTVALGLDDARGVAARADTQLLTEVEDLLIAHPEFPGEFVDPYVRWHLAVSALS